MSGGGCFIAGTDTGVGKTRVTVGLLGALAEQGVRSVGMKPVASGMIQHEGAWINEDVLLIASKSAIQCDPADIAPYRLRSPVSPHIAALREGLEIEPARIAAAYGRLGAHAQLIIVEGTGGWLAPISPQLTMADVALRLGLPVVLVVGLRLGCLNHALLTAEAIRRSGLPLLGWIGSVLDPAMLELEANLETLEGRLPAARLGLLPFDPEARDIGGRLRAAAAAIVAARRSPGT